MNSDALKDIWHSKSRNQGGRTPTGHRTMLTCAFRNSEVFVLVLLLWLEGCVQPTHSFDDSCNFTPLSWNPTATARFGLSISLRKSDRFGCGMISQEALQIYVAAQWVVERLNKNGGYIPGVQFGFDVLDDCRSSTRAVQYALDYMDLYSGCTSNFNSSLVIKLGLIGPSRSSTAEETVNAMRNIPIPIISPAATVSSLTEGDIVHPNFFRTVSSDSVQMAAIIAILKRLSWTYVAVVYTDDNYGNMGYRTLRQLAARENICINASMAITSDPNIFSSITTRLSNLREKTEGRSLSVVYVGEKDKAENLIFNIRSKMLYGLHFIMSDSVGTSIDVFNSGIQNLRSVVALGTLTLSPSNLVLHEFEDYLNTKYKRVMNGSETDATIKSFLQVSGWREPLPRQNQIPFVPLAVSAIFVLAEATREAHAQSCGGTPGLCSLLKTEASEGAILRLVQNISVDFGRMDPAVAPREFQEIGYVIEFDKKGDIIPRAQVPDYTVFAFDDDPTRPYIEVGNYSSGKLTLNMSRVRMTTSSGTVVSQLQTSVCLDSCQECIDNGTIPLAHLPGSAYIIGIFSLHDRNAADPFKCGKFRNVSLDAVVLEAFLHGVESMRNTSGIDFGAIAFDDCYSPSRINSILSDFLSGLIPTDRGIFGTYVRPENVVGVIGTLSSGSTIAAADFFTPLRVPVISYAASSPDLDDDFNFPYFLRTVPSDDEQAKAMAEVVHAMGWNYVGLLYVANNYGTRGAQAFQRAARRLGICVAKPVAITENPTSLDEIQLVDAYKNLTGNAIKVVVFFGIDTRISDFLKVLESRQNEPGSHMVFVASEEWATKESILRAGRKAARGSLTFKVDNVNIDPKQEESFRTKLLSKVPKIDDVNPWFMEFWQHTFNCKFPGGFNNIFPTVCDPNRNFDLSQVNSMLADQRVKHVINAVYAMTQGLKQAKSEICENSFPCPFLRSDKYAPTVYELIRSQTVTVGAAKESIFDEKGNGDMGFSIYNVQREGDYSVYKPVGVYTTLRGLNLQKNDIVFYTDTGQPMTELSAECSKSCAQCAADDVPVTTKAPQEASSEFRLADMVILIVLMATCLSFVCCLILGFTYFRRKVKGLSKELQEHKTEPVYHMVPDRRLYGNMQTDHDLPLAAPAQASRIRFVNSLGSRSESLNDTLDGRVNPAFHSDTSLRMTPRGDDVNHPPTPPRPQRVQLKSCTDAKPKTEHRANKSDTDVQHEYDTMDSSSDEGSTSTRSDRDRGASRMSGHNGPYSLPAQGSEREEIPMQNLSSGHAPYYLQQRHDERQLHEKPEDEGLVQYFHMAASGQLQEMDDESTALKTYTLSQRQTPPQEPCDSLNDTPPDYLYTSAAPSLSSDTPVSVLMSPELRELLFKQLLSESYMNYQEQQKLQQQQQLQNTHQLQHQHQQQQQYQLEQQHEQQLRQQQLQHEYQLQQEQQHQQHLPEEALTQTISSFHRPFGNDLRSSSRSSNRSRRSQQLMQRRQPNPEYPQQSTNPAGAPNPQATGTTYATMKSMIDDHFAANNPPTPLSQSHASPLRHTNNEPHLHYENQVSQSTNTVSTLYPSSSSMSDGDSFSRPNPSPAPNANPNSSPRISEGQRQSSRGVQETPYVQLSDLQRANQKQTASASPQLSSDYRTQNPRNDNTKDLNHPESKQVTSKAPTSRGEGSDSPRQRKPPVVWTLGSTTSFECPSMAQSNDQTRSPMLPQPNQRPSIHEKRQILTSSCSLPLDITRI